MRTKNIAMILTMALTAGLCQTAAPSQAATPKLSAKKLTMKVGKTAALKVKKTSKKAKWSIVSGKKNIRLTAKKKTSVKVKAVKAGKAKISCKIGKKKLVCKVSVKSDIKENDVKMKYNNVVFTKDFVEKVNSISFGKKIVKDKMTQRKLCALFTKLKFEETLELKGLHKKVNVNAETLKVGELTPLIFTLSDGTKCYVDSTESQFGVTTEGQTKYYNVIEAINENEFWEKIDELVDRYCEK
ncbi:hypothetical protein [Eubacterium sp.]|uniref:hypothetical protein n=1 Tax=Eubacterium sp. TaxID=142586 RepID=UPI00399566B0